jgi:hypothetical protein
MTWRAGLLSDADRDAYAALLAGDGRSLIYASLEYRDFLAEAVEGQADYLAAWKDDALVGVLPLFTSPDTPIGRVVNSLPWYGSHGGCVVSPGHAAEARRMLLQAYLDHCARLPLLSATLVMPLFEPDQLDAYVAALNPRVVDGRIGQVTEFPEAGPQAEDELMRRFRYPAQVRKSFRQGFELIRTDEDWAWEFLFSVHVENMEAVGGKAKPWTHFQALRAKLPAAWRGVSVAMLDGTPVAALLLLYFNKTVEYFTPVIKHDYRPRQPLSFLIWNGMADAMQRGFRRWNWGGTWIGQKSLHHFKSGWGADDHAYSYLTIASDEAVETIRTHQGELGTLFPYYFCYPFDRL